MCFCFVQNFLNHQRDQTMKMDLETLKENFIKEKLDVASMRMLHLNACRACLKTTIDKPVPIFGSIESLAEQIQICANVQTHIDDGLPNILCINCYNDLCTAHSFRKRCQLSDDVLRKYYLKSNVQKIEETNDSKAGERFVIKDIENVIMPSIDVKTEPYIVETELSAVKTEQSVVEPVIECNSSEVYDNDDVKDSLNNNQMETESSKTSKMIKKVRCNLCSQQLHSELSLQIHIKKIHGDSSKKRARISRVGTRKVFCCEKCPYSTPYRQSLVYHVRIHTGEKPFKCDICDKCFSQPSSLNNHKKTHSDKTYFTCAECGKQFKYKETYEAHKNVHIATRNFICHICNKGLKSKKTLEEHVNRHNNIKNYSCETCGSRFVTHVELLNHSKIHSSEKKFSCNICDFKTNMKKSLENHMRRHMGERPFKCDLCELACYTKGELKCHRRKHTKEKNYSCPVCEIRFIHSSSVNKHMFKTHGLKYNRLNIVDRRVVK